MRSIIAILPLLLVFSGCKRNTSRTSSFGTSTQFSSACPTEDNRFDYWPDGVFDIKDIETCATASDMDRYWTVSGITDGNKIVQNNLGKVFGNSPFQIKARHPDEKPYCLASAPNTVELSWVQCDDRSKDTLFYMARTPVRLTIKDSQYSPVSMDQFALQIVPEKELNDWSFMSKKELRCLSASRDSYNIKLARCGSGRDVWLNLPNSFRGDKILNIQNRFSNMILLDQAEKLKKILTEEGHIHPVMAMDSGFAINSNGRSKLDELTSEARPDVNITIELNKQDILDPQGKLFKITTRNNVTKCNNYAFDVVEDQLQYSCLNIYDSNHRDNLADGDVAGADVPRKWSKLHNLHILFMERCEGRLVPGTYASCNSPQTIRSIAETRSTMRSSVIQLKTEDDTQCAFLEDGNISYKKCNTVNEKGSWFVIDLSMDETSFSSYVAEDGTEDLREDLWGFNATIRPFDQQDKCVEIEKSGSYKLASGCTPVKVRNQKLLLSGRLTNNSSKIQHIRYCKSGLNIRTGIDYDCQDYVSPSLRRMLIAADVLSFIPVINVIVSPILQGIVCGAKELTISQEGCLGLAMGLPIDLISLPFDLMTGGAIMNGIKAAATRSAMRNLISQVTDELGEEIADQSIRRVVTSLQESTEAPINFDELANSVPKIVQNLSEKSLTNSQAIDDFVKVLNRRTSAADLQMANQLARHIVKVIKAESKISPSSIEKYIQAYFAKKNATEISPTSREALEQALYLQHHLSPATRRELGNLLGGDIFMTGIALSVFTGVEVSGN